MLTKTNYKQPQTNGDEVSCHTGIELSQSNGSKSKYAKLPKLLLKHFSGEPSPWLSFLNSYESSIDTNDDLSHVNKFNYLKTLLKVSAASTIAGLHLSTSNYATPVQLLKPRFENKHMRISSNIDSLLKITILLRQNNDKIETHIRGLIKRERKSSQVFRKLACDDLRCHRSNVGTSPRKF